MNSTHHARWSAAAGLVLEAAAVLASAALALLASAPDALARNPNPGIVPPNAAYGGLTYGEWQAALTQWILAVPAADSPLLVGNEDKLAVGQPPHVWFLANTAPVVDRHFIIPAGKALYASIFSTEWDNFLCVEPDTNYTVDELREIVKSIVDSFVDIQVQVDGVPVEDVAAYRSTTPVFSATLPEGNLPQYFGCADALPGTYGPMVADGYTLLIAPLPVGEHAIHIAGVVVVDPGDPSKNVVVDVRWRITVTPHRK